MGQAAYLSTSDSTISTPVCVMHRDRIGPFVFACEHASHAVPPRLAHLLAPQEVLASHAGWNPGAADLASQLATRLDGPLISAGAAQAEHVIKPAVDAFNKAANGETEIELFFANQIVPTGELFQAMLQLAMNSSHYDRQWWYWGGEANLRVNGTKMKLTSIPDDEWAQVEKAAVKFRDEPAKESETKKNVVDIFRKYNADKETVGRSYRYG